MTGDSLTGIVLALARRYSFMVFSIPVWSCVIFQVRRETGNCYRFYVTCNLAKPNAGMAFSGSTLVPPLSVPLVHHAAQGVVVSTISLIRRSVPGSMSFGRLSRLKYPISAISTLGDFAGSVPAMSHR